MVQESVCDIISDKKVLKLGDFFYVKIYICVEEIMEE